MAITNYITQISKAYKDESLMLDFMRMSDIEDNKGVKLSFIPTREKEVAKLYAGINCEKKEIKDIAEQFGVTEKRIKQVLANTTRKILRNYLKLSIDFLSKNQQLFEDYLNERNDI